MTDIFRNASDQALRYRAPLVKVIEIKAQGVLCGSPGVNEWTPGSDSEEDMEEGN